MAELSNAKRLIRKLDGTPDDGDIASKPVPAGGNNGRSIHGKSDCLQPFMDSGATCILRNAVVLVDMHGFLKADTPCLGYLEAAR